jgi:non-lysosomal glucosylceramidase
MESNEKWLNIIANWHREELEKSPHLPAKVKGAQINELYYIAAGGSVWVTRPIEGHGEKYPQLTETWHFGILEGFDTGYYYYNTLDLWVYAFIALSKQWPKLAENVFNDFLASAIIEDDRLHMVYRTATLEKNLVHRKLPHDLGSAPEDPWVQLNGYVHRDDPNLWKDHNPAFIITYYLHKKLTNSPIKKKEYDILVEIAKFTEEQDKEDIGVPRHSDFGDSTWDNLDMQGLSTYASSLCIGAWAVMADLAKKFDGEKAAHYQDKLAKAQKTIETLWNGKYYKTNDLGKYRNATMTDSLFGVFLAKKAGLGDLIPREHVISHLMCIYENNLMAYEGGKYGPLLVAEPGRLQYDQDGGEELQVNEVLVGSAWTFTAMLYEYGLDKEGEFLANNLRNMIYQGTGLQFRTPAAWDNKGQYRAPMNMRPLAIWML